MSTRELQRAGVPARVKAETLLLQDDVRADGNYFKSAWLGADHSVKFGFAIRRSPVESISTVGGGAQARYRGIYDFAPGGFITALNTSAPGFATNKVNMTKLESYMLEGNFFATMFYADVEGHPDDRGLKFALEELAFFSKELTILGVYPAHPFRATFREQAP